MYQNEFSFGLKKTDFSKKLIGWLYWLRQFLHLNCFIPSRDCKLLFMWELKSISHFNIYGNVVSYLLEFITALYQFINFSTVPGSLLTSICLNKIHYGKQFDDALLTLEKILSNLPQINGSYFRKMALHTSKNKSRASVWTREFRCKQSLFC